MKETRCYPVLVCLAAGLLLLVLACAPRANPTPAAAPRATPAVPAPQATPTPAPKAAPATPTPRPPAEAAARPAWEREWQELVQLAKKEGELDLRASGIGSDGRSGLVKAVSEKFGLKLEMVTGQPLAQTEKLLSERRAGINLADVYMGGADTLKQLKEMGVVEPLDKVLFLPEVVDPKLWKGHQGVFYDKAHMIGGTYGTVKAPVYVNPELVKPGEIKSLKDLLDPKWKGKISINDPTTPGGGKDAMVNILIFMGEDYIRKLVEQQPVVIRDKRLQVEWLVKGKYPVAIGGSDTNVAEFRRAGAVVTAITPEEGAQLTTGNGALGLVKGAPHPNAARFFLNWILSREGQTILAPLAGHGSRRVDVSNEWLAPEQRPQPGVRYLFFDEDLVLKGPEHMKLFKEILKPLM